MAWHPQYKPLTKKYAQVMHTEIEVNPGIFVALGSIMEAELRAHQAKGRETWARRIGWNKDQDTAALLVKHRAGKKATAKNRGMPPVKLGGTVDLGGTQDASKGI